MRITTLAAVAALDVLGGCVSHGGSPPGGSSTDVVGMLVATCHQAVGDVDVPVDASARFIQAYVPDDTPSGFRVVSASGNADGSFVLHDIPEDATYLLQFATLATSNPRYFVTDHRTPELRFERQGRCTPAPATASAAIAVDIDLTNSVGFSSSDQLQVDSFGLGVGAYTSSGVAGTTTLRASIPWRAGFALPDAAAGDDVYVLHARVDQGTDPQTSRPVQKRQVIEWFDATGSSFHAGQTAPISGALSAAAPPHTGTLVIDHAQFEALYDPTSRPGDFSVQLLAQPGAGAGPTLPGVAAILSPSPSAALLLGVSVSGSGGAPVGRSSATSYSYADPFPASWRRWIAVDYARSHLVRLSSDPSAPIGIATGYHQQVAYPGAFDIAPALAPPAAITVGGVEFSRGGSVAFDGQSPIAVRWDATPGAQLYELTIARVAENPGFFATATVTTAGTSLRLPAAIFDAAISYQLTLKAIQTPTDYGAGHLIAVSLPQVTAGVPSGRFRFLPSCGDGVVQTGEDCDTSGASATCNADCTVAMCGDGVINEAAGEQCDAINESASCTPACRLR